jgi:hypothetical protein
LDLSISWIVAFNKKGICWDLSTKNESCGTLLMGLDADANYMTVYAYTTEQQQSLRVAYSGSKPLHGVAITMKTR